jgi:hypothetical protein
MKEIVAVLTPRSADFPAILSKATERTKASRFWAIGDLEILSNPLLGLLCSIRGLGRVIVQTCDLARALRDAGIPVIATEFGASLFQTRVIKFLYPANIEDLEPI